MRSASPISIRCGRTSVQRFLNPSAYRCRTSTSISPDGRDRVIDYVKRSYGADSVSQIATFGTMAAKAAVRDVGRARPAVPLL
jgi:DNA polymerase-3 subunit alpha